MQSPAYDQSDFRGREDDGGESAATWITTTNTDWTELYTDVFRLRLAVTETNGGSTGGGVEFQLQYNLNGAGWNNITTSSSVVQATTSEYFADGDTTTQQITTNTFTGGEMAEDGIAGDVNKIEFSGNDINECEWKLDFVDADVSNNDTIQFRAILGDGTLLDSYTNTPTVTVSTSQSLTSQRSADAGLHTTLNVEAQKTLSGTCTFDGSGVSGAVIYVVNTINDEVEVKTTSDSNGNWVANVPKGNTYHVAAQYDDGTDKYNEHSKPFLVT